MKFEDVLDSVLAKYNSNMRCLITNESIEKTKDLINDYKNVLNQAREDMSPVDYKRYYNKYCLMASYLGHVPLNV